MSAFDPKRTCRKNERSATEGARFRLYPLLLVLLRKPLFL